MGGWVGGWWVMDMSDGAGVRHRSPSPSGLGRCPLRSLGLGSQLPAVAESCVGACGGGAWAVPLAGQVGTKASPSPVTSFVTAPAVAADTETFLVVFADLGPCPPLPVLAAASLSCRNALPLPLRVLVRGSHATFLAPLLRWAGAVPVLVKRLGALLRDFACACIMSRGVSCRRAVSVRDGH